MNLHFCSKKIEAAHVSTPLSVILAVRNDEVGVGGTIESVLNQSFQQFEFIIVNDGSNDGTSEILKNYTKRDSRIKVLEPGKVGLTVALNIGCKNAVGCYLGRVDSGDLCHLRRFERQIQYLENRPSVTVCFSWSSIIDREGTSLGEMVFNCKHGAIKRRLEKGRNIFFHGSCTMRKDAFISCNGYDVAMLASQDFDLWLRMIKAGYKIGAVPEVLYYWRLDPASISINKGKRQDYFKDLALRRYYDQGTVTRSDEGFEGEAYDQQIRLQRYYLNLFWRVRNKQEYWRAFKYLLVCKALTPRDILKGICFVCPIDHRRFLRLF